MRESVYAPRRPSTEQKRVVIGVFALGIPPGNFDSFTFLLPEVTLWVPSGFISARQYS